MDEVFDSKLYMDGDTLVHKIVQPTEDLILERNAELRKNQGSINDLGDGGTQSWGRQVASVPFVMWYRAIKDGFQLNHKNSEFANSELLRYLKSEEGKKCLIGDKV